MSQDRFRRPDLVLIMTDQQRFDQLGYARNGSFETPSLDALATQGTIFETAYSASTTCVPARTALLTGIQPHRLPTQENGAALREGFWTVAHELRRAGYQTALIGKMHFAPVHAAHGFETMRLCEHLKSQGLGPLSRQRDDEVDDYHHWLVGRGLNDWRLAPEAGPMANMPRGYPIAAHPTSWIEEQVRAFLQQRDKDRPLFLVISFLHPHGPFDPPEPYASMYDPADSILPTDGYDVNRNLPFLFELMTSEARKRSPQGEPALRQFLATARGLVRQIDDAVGRISDSLAPGTITFFTSDHGDFSGHRGLMYKDPWIPFDDLAGPAVRHRWRRSGWPATAPRGPELRHCADVP